MRTAEEQYELQYKEIKRRWRKDRKRRALGMLITGLIGLVAALIAYAFFKSDNFAPWNWIIMLCGGALALATPITIFRIFTNPIRQEEAEIRNLNDIYEQQRFINREG